MTHAQASLDAKLLRGITVASLGVALFLIGLKALAWWWSDSVSLLASLMDSSLDLLASCMTWYAVRTALRPADAEHGFGHGKAEPLAAIVQAMLIGAAASLIALEAIGRLWEPKPIVQGLDWALGVMVISVCVTLILVIAQRVVVARTGSPAVRADSVHYQSDLLANLGVILALVLSAFGWYWLDPAIALLIAAYIVYCAWDIARDAVDMLMDKELPESERAKILDSLTQLLQTEQLIQLRTRRSGRLVHVECTLSLPATIRIARLNELQRQFEHLLKQDYPQCELSLRVETQAASAPLR